MKPLHRVLIRLTVLAAVGAMVESTGGCGPVTVDVRYDVDVSERVLTTTGETIAGGPRIESTWRVNSHGLAVVFKNPHRQEATILWSGAQYVRDSVPESLLLVHGGPRRADADVPLTSFSPREYPDLRDRPHPPTSIPPGGKIEAQLLPRSNAGWRTFTAEAGGSWYDSVSMFGISPGIEASEEERERLAQKAVGKTFVVRIPFRIAGDFFIQEYRFRVIDAQAHAVQF